MQALLPTETDLSKADIFGVFAIGKMHTVVHKEFEGVNFWTERERHLLQACRSMSEEADRLTNSWRSKNLDNPNIVVLLASRAA